MNNKIKELAVQAGISFIPYMDSEGEHPDAVHSHHLEQFAKLVVKECVRIIEENDKLCADEWDYAEQNFVATILTQFGIEE